MVQDSGKGNCNRTHEFGFSGNLLLLKGARGEEARALCAMHRG